MSNIEVLTRRLVTGYIDAFTGPEICLSSNIADEVDFETLVASGHKVSRLTLPEASDLIQHSGVDAGETLVLALDQEKNPDLFSPEICKERHTIVSIKEDRVPVKGEVSFLSHLGNIEGAILIPYGLLDQNIWLRKLWGSDYNALTAELDSFLEDPFVADLWFVVEKYMVSSLPEGFSAHTLVVLSPNISDRNPSKVSVPVNYPYTFAEWASGLVQAFLQSHAVKIETWMHTQNQNVLEFLQFLDRHLFEKALRRRFFQEEFRAAFWDQWAITQVRGWYREEHLTGTMTYKGVQLGEPAEYENLQLVLAVLKAGMK